MTRARRRVDYSKSDVPNDYHCSRCGAYGCKLWRKGDMMHTRKLLCADCAATMQHVDISTLCPSGSYLDPSGILTNTLGEYIPAVPTPNNYTLFWAKIAIPPEGMAWWQRLPNRTA